MTILAKTAQVPASAQAGRVMGRIASDLDLLDAFERSVFRERANVALVAIEEQGDLHSRRRVIDGFIARWVQGELTSGLEDVAM